MFRARFGSLTVITYDAFRSYGRLASSCFDECISPAELLPTLVELESRSKL
jgi:hypothetical protein